MGSSRPSSVPTVRELEHSGIFGGIRIHHKDPRVLNRRLVQIPHPELGRASFSPFQPSLPGNPLLRQVTGSSGPLLSPSRTLGRVRSIKRDGVACAFQYKIINHAHRRGRANYRARPRILVLDHSFSDLTTPRHEAEWGPGTSVLILEP